jgi:hypothetical protein
VWWEKAGQVLGSLIFHRKIILVRVKIQKAKWRTTSQCVVIHVTSPTLKIPGWGTHLQKIGQNKNEIANVGGWLLLRSKRDSSTAQADNFARAKLGKKRRLAPVRMTVGCLSRNKVAGGSGGERRRRFGKAECLRKDKNRRNGLEDDCGRSLPKSPHGSTSCGAPRGRVKIETGLLKVQARGD